MLLRKHLLFFLSFTGIFSLVMIASGKSVNFSQPYFHPCYLADTLPSAAANKKIDTVEVEAQFPGGESGWIKFLEQNLNPNVPVNNGAPAGSYTVWVQFIVDTEGNLSNLKALTHHGYGMEPEVLRILRKSPKWLPAMQNNRSVKAYRKQPITFVVQEEKKRRRRSET